MESSDRSALIIVDLQNDFCPGGALAVDEGGQIVSIINRLQHVFDVVVATQDWHPANHSSFSSNGPDGIWPDHCVQGSPGAEFVEALETERISRVFQKGTDTAIDSYSGFFDNDHVNSTGLSDWLRDNGVSRVYVVGLAIDYCVKFTALDAVAEGFETTLVVDATRGVERQPCDIERAVSEMKAAGVSVVTSGELLGEMTS